MDNVLKVRPAAETRWDCASFGEVMLRFDPGFGRVRNARSFQVWEGGGEYNVARAMRKCWGKRATAITALPVNDLGWLVEDLMMQGGVDTSKIIWREFDGLGRNTRVGLNFTEKGFGIRAALGCSDRGHSAASQIKPGEVNWEKLFGEEGVRWFHTGGIFAALAPNTSEAVIEAVEIARKYGTIVSYDLNYRASLWKSQGGKEGAQKINRNIAKYVDVMIGNEEDFTACLGFEVEGLDEHISAIDPANFKKMIQTAVKQFPITIVHNPSPDDGQASSVRIGLQALSPRLDAVIVALADQPLIDAQDIVALIGAFKKRGDAAMVVPRVSVDGGEPLPGNPVMFDAALRDEWLAGEADAACRKWRLANPERVRWFDTDNRRYRVDIDTPEDLERFTASTGHTLQWPATLARETAA